MPEIYETVIYGPDLSALAEFYTAIIGLPLIQMDPNLLAAFRLPAGGVLLIFVKAG